MLHAAALALAVPGMHAMHAWKGRAFHALLGVPPQDMPKTPLFLLLYHETIDLAAQCAQNPQPENEAPDPPRIPLGGLGMLLGRSCALLAALGALLGALWPLCEHSWPLFGPPWALFGPPWVLLGGSWVPLGLL